VAGKVSFKSSSWPCSQKQIKVQIDTDVANCAEEACGNYPIW
jgi:hypothetical protein